MTKYAHILELYREELKLALGHLEYSYNKVQNLSSNPADLDNETLETWESFASRFARITDIFLSKFIRTRILLSDPAFRGELRDFVDQAEKANVLSNADKWMQIRELRNKIAHEYTKMDLSQVFKDILVQSPFVLKEIKSVI